MNLLEETKQVLKDNDKYPLDIVWIGSPDFAFDWCDFEKLADVEYNERFGAAKVASDLVIVGNGWWLERYEYDGAEHWKFKAAPKVATAYNLPAALTTPDGWETLKQISDNFDGN